MLTDPIADMFTRIRNAGRARLARATMPSSRLKCEIARVLKEQGYLEDYRVEGDAVKPLLVVELRYASASRPMIDGLERVSRPGRRLYLGCDEIPRIRNGAGIGILSTPQGVLTDEQARAARVGGELLARVW